MSRLLRRRTEHRLLALSASIVLFVSFFGLASAVSAQPSAVSAQPLVADPQVDMRRIIRTSPFIRTNVAMLDNEGSTYVARDNSLWLLDDDARRAYEVNPSTGALKRVIVARAFKRARQYGGGPMAGKNRVRDLESMAYDRRTDTLYAFSGTCCTSTALPTAYRLVRKRGAFRVESYQPLPGRGSFTAAGWNPGSKRLFVGGDTTLRRYMYGANRLGRRISVPDLKGIRGIEFNPKGTRLLVVRSAARLSRVNWRTKRLMSGWRSISLESYGVGDSRAVAPIKGTLFVSDGYGGRNSDDRLRNAVFVLNVTSG